MKKILLCALAALALFSQAASAQTKYYDAAALQVYGRLSDDVAGPYRRLPAWLETKARDAVVWHGKHCAGLYVKFTTNSTSVSARWTSSFKTSMNHMADAGSRGVDLYYYDGSAWRFIGTGRPIGQTTEQMLIGGMTSEPREYMMYLSLYDGIDSLEIGVDEWATFEASSFNSPRAEKPVIVYGTSITQGGCVSRPGMCYTSILERRLDRQFINLGFSGNGIIENEIAEAMAAYPDPGCYVLDYVGNADYDRIEAYGEGFFRILRDAHPDVPIIFVGGKKYPHSVLNNAVSEKIDKNDAAQKALYMKLKKAGEKNIYYSPRLNLTGDDCEGTVDGIHLTDYGVMKFVDHLYPVYKKALKK